MNSKWRDLALADGSGLYLAGQLRDDWIVVGFYVPLGGELHLAELSLVPGKVPPTESPDPSAVTSAGWLARRDYLAPNRSMRELPATRPPRAVFARLVRLIPFDEMQREAETSARTVAAFGRFLRSHGAPIHSTGFVETFASLEDNLSAAKLEYLDAARQFASAPKQGRPVLNLAEKMNISAKQLSDRLSAARKAGYLTSPGAGRKGGELTDLGRALVARHFGKTKRPGGLS